MQSTFKLNSHDKAILLDVLSIFMTLDSNENTALQKVCDTLFSALPINLVWGGLIDDDRNLTVSAAAGNSAPLVNGIIMDCNDVLDSKPMHSLDNSLPTSSQPSLHCRLKWLPVTPSPSSARGLSRAGARRSRHT
jgi:hypothetical protein